MKSLTYAGHSAVLIDTGSLMVGIDPWLLGNPLCPATLQNPKRLDLIVLTHGHSDHAGDAVRLAKHTGASVAATYELAMIMVGEGVPEKQVIAMNKGGAVNHHGLKIRLTHAFHSSSYDSERGTLYAGEPCGVILNDGTHTIYHAGDTELFSDMSLIGAMDKPEIAFLPIGDRFTMNPQSAAEAAALIGCKTAIPIHFGTFPALTGTPKEFTGHCAKKGIQVRTLEPGEAFNF